MKKLEITKPFEAHAHVRTGQMLIRTLPFTSCIFKRAVIMGNLTPPITTAADVKRYREEILLNASSPHFEPVMSIMLTHHTTQEIIHDAFFKEGVRVLKLIPGGTSTGSDNGIPLSLLKNYYFALEEAERIGMIFSGHWELITDSNGKIIPEMEREERAIPFLAEVVRQFPRLKIIAEHVTTAAMVKFVKQAPQNVAATIASHYLVITAKDVFDRNGRIKNPLLYCKPVAKTKTDQQAVIEAATSGHSKFFFGSDSAPWSLENKKKSPPTAGIFSAPVALPLLAETFEKHGALEKLSDFTGLFGPFFYGLRVHGETLTLQKRRWKVPFDYENIPIFLGGKTLQWQIA
jgi:dihydroorotase